VAERAREDLAGYYEYDNQGVRGQRVTVVEDGMLRGFLIAFQIQFGFVTPAEWQKVMECRTKGDKNVTKDAAYRIFPNLKITHAIADALLIAEYARRKHYERNPK